MKQLFFVLQGLILLFSTSGTLAQFDERKPYGRICFSVLETISETEYEIFRPGVKPGPNRKIVAFLDANSPVIVLVAAFDEKERRLAHGWMPQFLDVPNEWTEKRLPQPPIIWNWVEDSRPFSFYVLFLAKNSKESGEIRKLVAAIQESKQDEPLLRAQTQKLYECFTHTKVPRDLGGHDAIELPPLVSGVFRGQDFKWRDHAGKVNFDEDHPGLLRFPSTQTPRASPREASEPDKKLPGKW